MMRVGDRVSPTNNDRLEGTVVEVSGSSRCKVVWDGEPEDRWESIGENRLEVIEECPFVPTRGRLPSIEQLLAWENDGGCEATDGCWVEPDGTCPHGCNSWLVELGMI